MEFKGFVREIDGVGRVVIPKQLRKEFGLTQANSHVVISVENSSIVMRKVVDCCIFCKSELDLSEFDGRHICAVCLEKLKKIS